MKIRLKRHSSKASNSRRSPILLNPRKVPLKNNPLHVSSSATVPTLIPTISQILPIHVTVEEVAVDNIRKKGAGSISGYGWIFLSVDFGFDSTAISASALASWVCVNVGQKGTTARSWKHIYRRQ